MSSLKKVTTPKERAAARGSKTSGTGKTVSREVESKRFSKIANSHMERAREKIYNLERGKKR